MGAIGMAADRGAAARSAGGGWNGWRSPQSRAGDGTAHRLREGSARRSEPARGGGREQAPGLIDEPGPRLAGRHSHSVRSAMPVRPPTVLVAEMNGGALLVQCYPSGLTIYLSPRESDSLRAALDAVFGDVGSPMNIPPIVRPRI